MLCPIWCVMEKSLTKNTNKGMIEQSNASTHSLIDIQMNANKIFNKIFTKIE